MKTYIGHRYHWNSVILTHNANTNQTSDRIKETNPPQRYTVNIDSLTHTAKPTESQINIYSDRSLTDEHAGSGYTIQYKKKELIADSIRLLMHTTVFQAEIIAINEACKKFIDTKQSNMQYIKIFSDSQAAILALNSNTVTSSLVKQTIITLNALIITGSPVILGPRIREHRMMSSRRYLY